MKDSLNLFILPSDPLCCLFIRPARFQIWNLFTPRSQQWKVAPKIANAWKFAHTLSFAAATAILYLAILCWEGGQRRPAACLTGRRKFWGKKCDCRAKIHIFLEAILRTFRFVGPAAVLSAGQRWESQKERKEKEGGCCWAGERSSGLVHFFRQVYIWYKF